MIALLLTAAAPCTQADPTVATVLGRCCGLIEAVERERPAADASLRAKVHHLVRLDEVTRQHLWMIEDPALDSDQRSIVEATLGTSLRTMPRARR